MNDDRSPEKDGSRRSYTVGYGRPPKDKQFQKGRSGNPRGRPKCTPSVATIIREELGIMVPLKGPAGPIKLPLSRAIIRRALIDAANGKTPASVGRGLRVLEQYGPTEDAPTWDLAKLDDGELEALEILLSKIGMRAGQDDDERGA